MDHKIFWQLNEAYQLGVCNQVQEETLSEEEYLDIEEWVEALVDEGYDLDQYTDDELYEAFMKEAFISPYKSRTSYNNPQGHSPATKADLKSQELQRTEPGSTRQKNQTRRASHLARMFKAGRDTMREELDLYDLVSEYLVSEGFCDSYEDADVIMANMSEEWREGIVEEVLEEFKPTGYSMGYHSPATGRGKKARQIVRQIEKLKMSGKKGQAQAVDFVNRMQDTPEGRSEVMATSRRNKSKLDARARRDAQRDSRG